MKAKFLVSARNKRRLSSLSYFFVLTLLPLNTVGQDLVVSPDSDVVRDVGEGFVATCEITGVTPTENPLWYGPGGGEIPESSPGRNPYIEKPSISFTTLRFLPVIDSHNGSYTCRYNTIEKSFELTLSMPISFGDTECNQEAVIYEEELVECKVTGNPVPVVSWQLPDGTFPGSGYITEPNGLRILNTSEDDEGNFTCRADVFSEFDFDQIIISVNVLYPPVFITIPQDSVGLEDQNYHEFNCKAIGDPQPNITWIFGGNDLVNGEKYIYDTDNNGTRMRITNLTESDDGIYTCHAENKVASMNASAYLEVYLKPRIEPETNLTVTKGNQANFTCLENRGNPISNLSWTDDKGNLYPIGASDEGHIQVIANNFANSLELIINPVEIEDEGFFTCIAENLVSTDTQDFYLDVQYPPVVNTNLTEAEVISWIGNPTNLTCVIEGDPVPNITWDRNGKDFDESFNYTVKTSGFSSSLLFVAYENDFGEYRCNGTNEIDGVQFSTAEVINLIQAYPPVVNTELTKVDVNSWIGNPTNLTCVIEGDPVPTVTWDRNGEDFNESFNHTVETRGFSSSLLFVAYENDFGEYRCNGTNEIDGVQFSTAEVINLIRAYSPDVFIANADPTENEIFVTWNITDFGNLEMSQTTCSVHYRNTENSEDWEPSLLGQNLPSTNTSHIVEGLNAYTFYDIQITCRNDVGEGDPDIETVRTDESMPSFPTNLEATILSSREVYLNWSMPDPTNGVITNYSIRYAPSDSYYSGNYEPEVFTGNNETFYTVSGLIPFTNYTFQVKASTIVGGGEYSNKSYSMTFEDVPGAPVDLTVTATTANSVMLIWEEPVEPNGVIIAYTVYYFMPGEINETVEMLNVTTEILVSELTVYTNYTFYVTANTSIGEGPPSEDITTRTRDSEPSDVTIAKLEAISYNEILLTWEKPVYPNGLLLGYFVRIGQSNMDEFQEWIKVGVKPLSYTFTELIPFTSYKAQIMPFNENFNGSITTSNDSMTTEYFPGAPVNLTVTATTANSVMLIWEEPVEPNGVIIAYTVYYFMPGEMNEMAEMLNVTTEILVSELTVYTNYTFYVTASTSIGEGPPSEDITTRTRDSEPSNVTIAKLEAISYNETLLTWEKPVKPNGLLQGYFVRIGQSNMDEFQEWIKVGVKPLSYPFTELIPFTSYKAQIIPFNENFNGSITTSNDNMTTEYFPGVPQNVILSENEKNTLCTVSWEEPTVTNGEIIQYCVNVKTIIHEADQSDEDPETFDPECVDGSILQLSVSMMNDPNKNYTAYVEAATEYGNGRKSTEYKGQCYSAKAPPSKPPSQPHHPDDSTITKSSFSLNISQANEENGFIDCYEVVVIKVDTNVPTKSPDDEYPPEMLDNAYVAYAFGRDFFKDSESKQITIGSESSDSSNTYCPGYESSRMRRAAPIGKGTNHPLESGTGYSTFLRAYVGNEHISSDYSDVVTTAAIQSDDGPSIGAIVGGSIAGIAIFIVILIILFMFILNSSRSKKKNSQRRVDEGIDNPAVEMIDVNGVIPPEEEVDIPLSVDPITTKHLPAVYANKSADKNRIFREEFSALPEKLSNRTTEISSKQENTSKNRFINILPYDQTRVVLKAGDSDYINACYLDGYEEKNQYIAAQGPLENTLNDFWYMIWEQKTTVIVMLTNLEERGKNKCYQYWPASGSIEYCPFTVTLDETKNFAEYIIRYFTVTNLENPEEKSRNVIQFHFTAWPDFGVPKSPNGMLKFLRRVNDMNPASSGPSVIHCSAGVGRTGTYIMLDIMLRMIAKEDKVDIFNYIRKMREQRSNMVQTEGQYVFIHQSLLDHVLHSETEIDVSNMRQRWLELTKEDPRESGKTNIELEFMKLNNASSDTSLTKHYGQEDDNRSKNRVVQVIPYDHTLARLERLLGKDYSDYINASFIDGYHQKKAYIATQGPLPKTVNDFWRLVWEFKSGSIVMLTELEEKGQERCALYWPDQDEPVTYGDLAVIKKEVTALPYCTIREFQLTHTKGGEVHEVKQFHFHGWPEMGIPESGDRMINLIGLVQKQQQHTHNKPIVVHCSSGAGRTGAYCALSIVLERIKAEGHLDIFQTVKALRLQRPHMVQTMEQYQFIYKTILEYLDSFDAYDNFK